MEKKRFLVYLFNMLLLVLIVAGLVLYSYLVPADTPSPSPDTSQAQDPEQTPDPAPAQPSGQETPDASETPNPDVQTQPEPSDETVQQPAAASQQEQAVRLLLSSMTQEEKVWQLFFVTPEALTGQSPVTLAGEATRQALEARPVGGLVYFAKNLIDREQTLSMLANTQSYSRIPLFLGVDEEGGTVSRIGANPAMGGTKLPDMAQYGEAGDPDAAAAVGQLLGEELSGLGFNVDFAPVADIVTNPDNTEIGRRSFSSDPQVAADMVSALVSGLQEKPVLATLKHFPGHGSTSADSHTGRSLSSRTLDELRQAELIPFAAGIQAGAAFVMVGHMSLPNVVGDETPCDLSSAVVTDLLRQELGFSGVIITDSQAMGAITQYYTSAQAAVAALQAGVDMVLMPADLDQAFSAVLDALDQGLLTQERLDESVSRILSAKYQLGLLAQ